MQANVRVGWFTSLKIVIIRSVWNAAASESYIDGQVSKYCITPTLHNSCRIEAKLEWLITHS